MTRSNASCYSTKWQVAFWHSFSLPYSFCHHQIFTLILGNAMPDKLSASYSIYLKADDPSIQYGPYSQAQNQVSLVWCVWVNRLSCSRWFMLITGGLSDCVHQPGDCVGPCIGHLLLFSTEMLIKHGPEAWLNVTQPPRIWLIVNKLSSPTGWGGLEPAAALWNMACSPQSHSAP